MTPKKVKRPTPAFLSKLYTIVNTSAPLCKWGPDGTSFIINDSATFAKEVLSKYFKSGNFQSFVRQLHFYNFRKLDKSKKIWEFRHEKFRQGQPELVGQIRRKTCSDFVNEKQNTESMQSQNRNLKAQLAECQASLASVLRYLHEHGGELPVELAETAISAAGPAIAQLKNKNNKSSSSSSSGSSNSKAATCYPDSAAGSAAGGAAHQPALFGLPLVTSNSNNNSNNHGSSLNAKSKKRRRVGSLTASDISSSAPAQPTPMSTTATGAGRDDGAGAALFTVDSFSSLAAAMPDISNVGGMVAGASSGGSGGGGGGALPLAVSSSMESLSLTGTEMRWHEAEAELDSELQGGGQFGGLNISFDGFTLARMASFQAIFDSQQLQEDRANHATALAAA